MRFAWNTALNKYVDALDLPNTKNERKNYREKNRGSNFCPYCKNEVNYRGGDVTQHFYHNHDCGYSKETEQHILGKLALKQYAENLLVDMKVDAKVVLELYLADVGENSRQADVAIVFRSGFVWALECQLSDIPLEVLDQRTEDYLASGCWVTWFFGAKAANAQKRSWSADKFGEFCEVSFTRDYSSESSVLSSSDSSEKEVVLKCVLLSKLSKIFCGLYGQIAERCDTEYSNSKLLFTENSLITEKRMKDNIQSTELFYEQQLKSLENLRRWYKQIYQVDYDHEYFERKTFGLRSYNSEEILQFVKYEHKYLPVIFDYLDKGYDDFIFGGLDFHLIKGSSPTESFKVYIYLKSFYGIPIEYKIDLSKFRTDKELNSIYVQSQTFYEFEKLFDHFAEMHSLTSYFLRDKIVKDRILNGIKKGYGRRDELWRIIQDVIFMHLQGISSCSGEREYFKKAKEFLDSVSDPDWILHQKAHGRFLNSLPAISHYVAAITWLTQKEMSAERLSRGSGVFFPDSEWLINREKVISGITLLAEKESKLSLNQIEEFEGSVCLRSKKYSRGTPTPDKAINVEAIRKRSRWFSKEIFSTPPN